MAKLSKFGKNPKASSSVATIDKAIARAKVVKAKNDKIKKDKAAKVAKLKQLAALKK